MTAEWKTRAFKSGNSVALRLPKALGLVEGDQLVIVPHADGSFTFWKEGDDLAMLLGLYGSMSPGFMKEGRGDTEQEDRAWDGRSDRSAA